MNEIFNFHGQEVRTLTIDDEPWFGREGYSRHPRIQQGQNAIALHVDEDDALKQGLTDNLGRVQETIIINESGLYSLILSSKLPQAKEFKRWVTSEVLPTLFASRAVSSVKIWTRMPLLLSLLDRRNCVNNKRPCWKISTTSRVSNRFTQAMLNRY